MNVFDVGGSSIGSEGVGKYRKTQKVDDVEIENTCDVDELQ